jgi:hypothetical protein
VPFTLQTFNSAIILLDYTINTKSYAVNCENKAHPQMHCNGKCQLMKKLQQQEKKDRQVPVRKLLNNIFIFSRSYSGFLTFFFEAIKNKYLFFSESGINDMPHKCFHPPCW